MSVTVERYDRGEASGRRPLSYAEVGAFATTTFALMGYPARVEHESELAGFVDWNFSASNREYFIRDHFVRGPSVSTVISADERDALRLLGDQVQTMTAGTFGRPMRPISTLLSQLGLFRVLMAMGGTITGRPLSVFEVGPGNGYLGGLLVTRNCRYMSMDNAQSLYLWQSRLLEHLAGAEFVDWAAGPDAPPADLAAYRVHHLPWWEYVRLRHRRDVQADIVVSNTNLGEMNYPALLYTVRLAVQLLKSSPLGLLVFTNIGDAKQNSMATVEGELLRVGFKRVCGNLFHAFAAPGTCPPVDLLEELDRDIPLFDPSGRGGRYPLIDALDLARETWPSDLDFISYLDMFTPPDDMLEA